MKKFAAAALAATMTLSLGAAPAEAASNRMSDYGMVCNLHLDGQGSGSVYKNEIKKDKRYADLLTAENVGLVRTSSDVGEAFGSSDADTIAAANNAEAVQACMNGENYQSQPMSDSKKAGIIIGVVLAVLAAIGSAAGPFIQPMLQQFMPR